MNMSDNNLSFRERVRHSILLQLKDADPMPLAVDAIHMGLSLGGQVMHRLDLLKELDLLQSNAYVTVKKSSVSPGLHRYSLTPSGKASLEGSA